MCVCVCYTSDDDRYVMCRDVVSAMSPTLGASVDKSVNSLDGDDESVNSVKQEMIGALLQKLLLS